MSTPESMRAAQFHRYGGPDVIRTHTVPTPTPGPGEVLIKVGATTVNGGELFFRAGKLRLMSGRRFPKGLGMDFAGTIETLGKGVTSVNVADQVWGVLDSKKTVLRQSPIGAAAEFVVADASRIAPMPSGIPAAEAVALLAGTTALTGLHHKARLQPGETVLIRGGTGGVGYAAIQLAKALGAHVSTLVSAGNMRIAHDLGADVVLDYRRTQPGELPKYDVIFDTVGSRMFEYQKLLKHRGRMVSITAVPILPGVLTILASTIYGSRRIRAFSGNPTRALLTEYARYIEAGQLTALIGGTHPLEDVDNAHRAMENAGGYGKRVISMP